LRKFWRTSLKQATKGAPTCDSLERVSTVCRAIEQSHIPVVAHGLEDCIVKLNWPRDEQRGVCLLGRHFLGWRWGRFSGWFWVCLWYCMCLPYLLYRLYLLCLLCLLFGLVLFLGLRALDVSAFVFKARAAFGGEGRVYLEERRLAI
jgi:hypothetical protein